MFIFSGTHVFASLGRIGAERKSTNTIKKFNGLQLLEGGDFGALHYQPSRNPPEADTKFDLPAGRQV